MRRRVPDSSRRTGRLPHGLVAGFACLLLLARVSAGQCAGDCDADGRVRIGELVTMVNVGMGTAPAIACAVGDANLDDRISVGEIMDGVGDSLRGCRAPTVRRTFDFRGGRQGWQAGFADYAPEMVEGLDLEAGPRLLPAEIGLAGPGFLLSGVNLPDDLFMFLKRRLGSADGIRPDRAYSVEYVIVFASDAPTGCLGIGGAPGESVFLKAGAAPVEPLPFLDPADDHVRMNVDKGNQAAGGPAASPAGDVANGLPCEPGNERFVSLRREHVHMPPVTASAEGDLWLLVGSDSGFEGRTTLYYQRIEVKLTPIDDL
jgi:hypothetical protein